MIKYLGKYYKGSQVSFLNGYDFGSYYDEYQKMYKSICIGNFADGDETWYPIVNSFEAQRTASLLNERMKEQLKNIDLIALQKDKRAYEEYEKYLFFIENEENLNHALRMISIKGHFGFSCQSISMPLITINQLDAYNMEDLQAILDRSYAKEFNQCLKR